MALQWSTGLACFDPHAGASRAPARLPTNQTLDEVFGRDAGFAMGWALANDYAIPITLFCEQSREPLKQLASTNKVHPMQQHLEGTIIAHGEDVRTGIQAVASVISLQASYLW
jgi:hypothetical protein